MDGLKQDKSEWVKRVSSILTKYNHTEHNATKIKPPDAAKKENHLWVNWHLQNSAKKDKEYHNITEGDVARVNKRKLI